ncbi:MAG: hypothetical protein V4750_06495 [Pseudomonadota bacterium]
MSLKRQLLLSFGVQGAGAAALLLATLWLGASLGPEVQGGFSRSKSELEFIAAFAMFGLPQALFFHVKSGGLNGRAALRWVMWSAILALPIGAGWALLQHGLWGVLTLLFGLAVAAGVAQGELRAQLLVRDRTGWFNAVTALPQVLVLAGVALVIVAATPPLPATWFVVFGVAYGATALLDWYRLHTTLDAVGASTIGWRALGHYGLAAWLTAALSTAAIVAVQRWVEATQGRAALGQFTLAMTLVQVPLTPISYAAPLLFRRWMERPGAQASRRWSAGLFLALLAIAALVGMLSTRWPDLGLGLAYGGATQALALLLVGGAAEAASRVLTVQASAIGLPWIAVRAEAARWGVLAVGWLAPLPPGLLPLCAVWSAAAAVAASVFAWHGRAAARSPR